ncbi:MAG: hypothetical protein EZS28_023142 [Streblomastix strix]|uniref:Uncharacterized protein n=1 Tax=Streblomastix strix TaxID=222440 RepID=A0A5J4VFG2_9EUKA|nr:MAG: hypothetical protein EZS28_023142 [Streblomastix strix]
MLADIVMHDYEARKMLYNFHKHNGNVQEISFSHTEQYIVTLGGFDDFVVVVWNVAEGKPSKSNPRIWDIDYKNIILVSNEIVQGHMRRIWTTAIIDNDDKYAYLGSTTGDIVAIDIQNYYIKHIGLVKDKDKLQAGISQIELFNLGDKLAAVVAEIVNGEIVLYKVNYPSNEKIPQLGTLGRTAVLGKITILKIQPLGYGLATKCMWWL